MLCDCSCGWAVFRLGMWRFAPARTWHPRHDQNAPCQLCRTMPAYPALAILWRNCVCARMPSRRGMGGAVNPNIEKSTIHYFSCSQSKPQFHLHKHDPLLQRSASPVSNRKCINISPPATCRRLQLSCHQFDAVCVASKVSRIECQ